VQRQLRLRTAVITPNDNKSFSIGTSLMVDGWYEDLELPAVIGRHKAKGIPLDPLVRGLLAYELGDNFSILQAGQWLNRSEVREYYELPNFNVKTLYRAIETLGRNRESIVRELQDRVLKLMNLESTDVPMFGRRSCTAET